MGNCLTSRNFRCRRRPKIRECACIADCLHACCAHVTTTPTKSGRKRKSCNIISAKDDRWPPHFPFAARWGFNAAKNRERREKKPPFSRILLLALAEAFQTSRRRRRPPHSEADIIPPPPLFSLFRPYSKLPTGFRQRIHQTFHPDGQ